MHQAAMKAAGINGYYLRLAASSAGEAFRLGKDMALRGLNVTAPFKEEAFSLSQDHDEESAFLRASNTIIFEDATRAFNTDVYGVSEACAAQGISMSGVRAVVLGAGGSARAAVCALRAGGAQVSVINRTWEKCVALAEEFGARAVAPGSREMQKAIEESSLIISCLSTRERVIPPEFLTDRHVILDAVYSAPTALVLDAKKAGAKVIDGLEWLLYQGAGAFSRFAGVPAPVADMRNALQVVPDCKSRKLLALIGMPGSGKTSVAQALASRLAAQALDVDDLIEQEEGRSIRSIFGDSGEERFRDLEQEKLLELASRESLVVSCGGGIVKRSANRETLRRSFFTIWLWASLEELEKRVSGDTGRPLLAGDEPITRLSALLEERLDMYGESADLVVGTENASTEEIADRIIYEMRAAGMC